MDIESILTEAHAAAVAAQSGMVEDQHALDCGFAWAHAENGRQPFINQCRKALAAKLFCAERDFADGKIDRVERDRTKNTAERYYGTSHWRKGWEWWSPGGAPVQAIGIHQAGANAFHLALARHGVTCETGSRYD